jgi:hypothetical protein
LGSDARNVRVGCGCGWEAWIALSHRLQLSGGDEVVGHAEGPCRLPRRDDYRRGEQLQMRRGSTLPGLKGGLEMTSSDRIGSTALVTGASRGFCRAIAIALLLTPAGLTCAG